MPESFDLQGHRGARGLFPENTLDGFRAAMALGVTRFELDVGITRDGVAVVHHDPALNPDTARGPDGAWIAAPGPRLRDLTLPELRRFDVGRLHPGSRYAAQFPDQRPQDGACVPTLEEVLRLGARFTIEMKLPADHPELTVAPEEMAERVAAVIEMLGVQERVAVSSFNWRAQRHMRRIMPAIEPAWLTGKQSVADAALWWDGVTPPAFGGSVPAAVAAEGGPTWQPEHDTLTEAQLHEAHRLGLRVVPWTVNRPEDMDRLIAWGVDGFITDRPDLGLEALRRAGR